MDSISYKKGYKYQITAEYVTRIPIEPEESIDTEYVKLASDGTLALKKGYAWDGPSGPTIDSLNFMRGSLVHDALYQLMRENHLEKDRYRNAADRLLQKMCREDGMSAPRAWVVYQAVKMFGDPAADPSNRKPVIQAPRRSG